MGLAILWKKKTVSLFPSFSHIALDLCHQKISSINTHLCIHLMPPSPLPAVVSMANSAAFFSYLSHSFMLFRAFAILSWIMPNTSLFHTLRICPVSAKHFSKPYHLNGASPFRSQFLTKLGSSLKLVFLENSFMVAKLPPCFSPQDILSY